MTTTQPDFVRFRLITACIGLRQVIAQIIDPKEECGECRREFNPSQLDVLTVKRERPLPARHSAQIEQEYKTDYVDLWLCPGCLEERVQEEGK